MKASYLWIVLVLAVSLIVGCSSNKGYQKASRASTSLEQSAATIDKSLLQLDSAMAALSDLVSNPAPDLTKQFARYNSAVNDLDSLARDVAGKAASMQQKGSAIFEQWDKDLATIQNEDIRNRSEKRKKDVMAQFDKLHQSYAQAQAAFGPLMADLKDIRTALTSDLTSAGVKAIESPVRKANRDAAPVRSALTKLAADFRELGVKLSASVPQPAK